MRLRPKTSPQTRPPIHRSGRQLAAVGALALLLAGCQQLGEDFDRVLGKVGGGDPDRQYAQALELDAAGRDVEAVRLYRRAARAGNAEAAFELGEAYQNGEGVDRDLDQAARWFNTAAQAGAPRGQYLLGRAYAEGRGVGQDRAKAARWYARAAVQNHAPAQYALGQAFMNGRGVPEDPLWAGRWYGKAARRGLAEAQFSYGALLAAGRRLPRDLALGHAILTMAAENGVGAAEELLPRVTGRMSRAERRDAKRYLRELRAGPEDVFADQPTVRYAQAALDRMGYDAGPIDGWMGPATRRGLEAFQRAQGREVDGELDAGLLQAILDATRRSA
jgi:hypothetical protein